MADQSADGGERTLHDLVLAAGSLLDPSSLARVAVAEARRVLDVDGASLAFWDEEQQLLVPLAFDDERVTDPYPAFHAGQGMIGEAFKRDAPLIVLDYAQDLENPAAWASVVSGLSVPLHADGRVLGALSTQTYYRRRFTAADVQLLETIAAQVGPALGTMRTLAKAQRQAAQAYALASLLRQGVTLDDEEELFTLVSQTAVRLLGADVAGVVFRDAGPDGSAWRGVVGNRTQTWRDHRYGGAHPASVTIFSGETELLRGAGVFDPDRFPFFAAEGVQVGASVPLDPLNGAYGALCLGWRFEAQLVDASVELAEALAAFSGTLVKSATADAQRDAIVAGAPVILIALDGDGIVTVCDGAGAKAIGMGPEVTGMRLAELLPDEPAVVAALASAAAGQSPDRLRVQVRGRTLDISVEVRERGTFLVGTDITERHAAERELVRRATEDQLTGLPNEAAVIRGIAEVLAREPVSAVVADIRNFDQINEAIGYDAADRLLHALGVRLAADLADAVIVGRTGGDEFAVATKGEDAGSLSERVRHSLEAFIGATVEDTMAVDVRCGLASMTAGGNPQTLLRHADAALQVARRGTEPVVVWDAAAAQRRRPQLTVAQQLRRALDDRTFTVCYQPIVDAHTGEVHHAEALARWPLGDGDPVSPDVFVPLAERLGRIGQLTAHVLDVALADLPARLRVPVSVNISPLDLMHGDLPKLVAERLGAHRVASALLMLEVTEHAALGAEDMRIKELATLGVSLSVDDFGRGYSSLETLKRMPARELKLDRAYVARAFEDPTDEAIVRAAVTVGHALGMKVVAEGVEDAVVLDAVRRFGCDLAQGYHFARPMNAATFAEWLAEHRPELGTA